MESSTPFELEIVGSGKERQIRFVNGSLNFAEVIFVIDGVHAKDCKQITASTRGFAYHPKEERRLTQTPTKGPLPFGEHGTVEAIVYEGTGLPTDESVDLPPFVRRRIGSKIRIKRFTGTPSARLRVSY